MGRAATHKKYRILCLGDDPRHRKLMEMAVKTEGMACQFYHTSTQGSFEVALDAMTFDLIISDFGVRGYDGFEAMAAARKAQVGTPFVLLTNSMTEAQATEGLKHARELMFEKARANARQ